MCAWRRYKYHGAHPTELATTTIAKTAANPPAIHSWLPARSPCRYAAVDRPHVAQRGGSSLPALPITQTSYRQCPFHEGFGKAGPDADIATAKMAVPIAATCVRV